MKLIILAAGRGTRLKHLTTNLPKGMLPFNGKSIIEWQLITARKCGISEIVIVTGFESAKINFSGIEYYHNPRYAETNMLESLFCAEKELEGEVIVSYADILYESHLMDKLITADCDIGVAVDLNWKNYWQQRYGRLDFDLESLVLQGDRIVEMGKENPPLETIDARYIGITRFSGQGIDVLKATYHRNKEQYRDTVWQQSGKTFENAYMTDMLNQIISDGHQVNTIPTSGGWLEFDTVEDYEFSLKVLQEERFNDIFSF